MTVSIMAGQRVLMQLEQVPQRPCWTPPRWSSARLPPWRGAALGWLIACRGARCRTHTQAHEGSCLPRTVTLQQCPVLALQARQGLEQAARGHTRCYPGTEQGRRASAGWSAACGPPRTQRRGRSSPTPPQAASGPPPHPVPDCQQGRLPPPQSVRCSVAQRLRLSVGAPCSSSRMLEASRLRRITFLGTSRLSSSDSGCGAWTMTLPWLWLPQRGSVSK